MVVHCFGIRNLLSLEREGCEIRLKFDNSRVRVRRASKRFIQFHLARTFTFVLANK